MIQIKWIYLYIFLDIYLIEIILVIMYQIDELIFVNKLVNVCLDTKQMYMYIVFQYIPNRNVNCDNVLV